MPAPSPSQTRAPGGRPPATKKRGLRRQKTAGDLEAKARFNTMIKCKPLATGVLLLLLGTAADADVASKSGNSTFDRAVDLVMENFYDPAALPRFEDAVKETIP